MLSTLATDLALSLTASGLDRKVADLTAGSSTSRAIQDTANGFGADRRSKVEAALRRWSESGAFVALLREVRGGARADVAARFVESFRERGGYHEPDPTREHTEDVLQQFVEALTHRLHESGDLRPLTARVDRLTDGQLEIANDVAAVRQRAEDSTSTAADWQRIEDHSRLWMDRVQDTIGGSVRLPRAPEREATNAALDASGLAVLVGASGTGKSAIVKAIALDLPGPVVWASPQRLAEWTLTEWRAQLGLHRSLSQLAATVEGTPTLVLDGLDRLYGPNVFEHVAEWLRVVRYAAPDSSWQVIATCTPEAWERVQSALAGQHIVLPPTAVLEVDTPDDDELEEVWTAFPELAVLKTRDHLSLIRRPKVLDLLARNRASLGDATRFGESDVARLFWTHEVAPAHRGVARAHAARSLATTLADRLRPSLREATLFDDLPTVGPDTLDELARDHVLARLDGSVAFAHDLYADWVRTQALRAENDEGTLAPFLAERARSPVWRRAVRLLGVDLLEQTDDPAAWLRAVDALAEAPGIEEADSLPLIDGLLEALVFSVRRGIGLLHDDVWPLLAADDGRLLRRLLRRLRVTATQPDPVLARYIAKAPGDPAVVRAIASATRVPAWPYWYGILSFLHRHHHEIPLAARGDVAEAVDFWLRKTGPGFPFRQEAAHVAVQLGEAVLQHKQQSQRVFMDDAPDQAVYSAVLAAAHEEPEAVTQIVLEGIGRRAHRFGPPPPTDEERSARRAVRQSFPPSLGRSGPVIGPFTDGPTVRSDGALQKVVWSVGALSPLCEALPSVASELLLASLISHARRTSSWNDLTGEYGLEYPTGWHPTFYIHGPFLVFLRTDEDQAVTTILRLLEHVEDRWLANGEHFAREKGQIGPLHVDYAEVWVDGRPKRFFGWGQIFGWASHSPGHGNVLSTALTALEKHVYDRIDNGEDVSDLLSRLLREARSVALLGVLCSVLQRHPELTAGPLRGLLVSPDVLMLVRGRAESRAHPMYDQTWVIGLDQIPRFQHEEYEDWHKGPHRMSPWIGDLGSAFVRHTELAPFFAEVRDWLAERLEPGGLYHGWEEAERIAMLLDPANYHAARGPDGQPAVAYRPPDEWAQRQEDAHLDKFRSTMLGSLPEQAAVLYMGQGSGAPDAQARVDEMLDVVAPDNDSGRWVQSPEIEVARAALCLHPTLGSQRPERQEWARNVLLAAAEDPDPTPGLYSFVGNMLRPPPVLAPSVVGLLARDPLNTQARTAVARHIRVSPLHDLAALARTAIVFSDLLGDDHPRIVHGIMRRAEIEARRTSAENQLRFASFREDDVDPDSARADLDQSILDLAALEAAFVEGALSPTLPDLDQLAALRSPFPRRGRSHERSKSFRPISIDHLSTALAAFPAAPEPGTLWYDALTRYAGQTFGPLAPVTGEEHSGIDGLPDAWQSGLLERLGRAAIALAPDAAEPLWKPVLDLGAAPRAWTDRLTNEVTRHTVVPNPDTAALETWGRMIRYALQHPAWGPGTPGTISAHDSGSSWRPLLGFTDVVGAYGWADEQRPAIDAVLPEILEWADRYLVDPSSVGWFAGLLAKSAFSSLTVPGLVKLAAAAEAHPRGFWGYRHNRDEAGPNLSTLLTHVWTSWRADLRVPDARAAFEFLLQSLVTRQDGDALILAEEVRIEGI